MSVRLHFKGGAWTNAEDQVLRAALSAGNRDWERVASNLRNKTGAQCRDRWENYLDPRLNIKEEWSVEEDTLLVELQQLFHAQWNLIAAQIAKKGAKHYIRPAWLCEERYLQLKAQWEYQEKQKAAAAEGRPMSTTLEQFMADRQRVWNARKAHEERAAKGDTVSGDPTRDDMVSITVGRLANQDQKKGLRKERERQLAEASFQAKLQNQREGLESGTLSQRQQKRMRRAIEEDERTGNGKRLRGESHAENDEEEEEDEDEEEDEEESTGGRHRRRFEPIDVSKAEEEAGVQRRQRVLIRKPLDATPAPPPPLLQLEAGEDEVLRLKADPGGSGSGSTENAAAAESSTPRLLTAGKAHSSGSSAGGITWNEMVLDAVTRPSKALVDLDDLFSQLPPDDTANNMLDVPSVELIASAFMADTAAVPHARTDPLPTTPSPSPAGSVRPGTVAPQPSPSCAQKTTEEPRDERDIKAAAGLSTHLLVSLEEEDVEEEPVEPSCRRDLHDDDEAAAGAAHSVHFPNDLDRAEQRILHMAWWMSPAPGERQRGPRHVTPTDERMEMDERERARQHINAAAATVPLLDPPPPPPTTTATATDGPAFQLSSSLSSALVEELHAALKNAADHLEPSLGPARAQLLQHVRLAFVDGGLRRWLFLVLHSLPVWQSQQLHRAVAPHSSTGVTANVLETFLFYVLRYWCRRLAEAEAEVAHLCRVMEMERVEMERRLHIVASECERVAVEEAEWQERKKYIKNRTEKSKCSCEVAGLGAVSSPPIKWKKEFVFSCDRHCFAIRCGFMATLSHSSAVVWPLFSGAPRPRPVALSPASMGGGRPLDDTDHPQSARSFLDCQNYRVAAPTYGCPSFPPSPLLAGVAPPPLVASVQSCCRPTVMGGGVDGCCPSRRGSRWRSRALITSLLIRGGVEQNPGPLSPSQWQPNSPVNHKKQSPSPAGVRGSGPNLNAGGGLQGRATTTGGSRHLQVCEGYTAAINRLVAPQQQEEREARREEEQQQQQQQGKQRMQQQRPSKQGAGAPSGSAGPHPRPPAQRAQQKKQPPGRPQQQHAQLGCSSAVPTNPQRRHPKMCPDGLPTRQQLQALRHAGKSSLQAWESVVDLRRASLWPCFEPPSMAGSHPKMFKRHAAYLLGIHQCVGVSSDSHVAARACKYRSKHGWGYVRYPFQPAPLAAFKIPSFIRGHVAWPEDQLEQLSAAWARSPHPAASTAPGAAPWAPEAAAEETALQGLSQPPSSFFFAAAVDGDSEPLAGSQGPQEEDGDDDDDDDPSRAPTTPSSMYSVGGACGTSSKALTGFWAATAAGSASGAPVFTGETDADNANDFALIDAEAPQEGDDVGVIDVSSQDEKYVDADEEEVGDAVEERGVGAEVVLEGNEEVEEQQAGCHRLLHYLEGEPVSPSVYREEEAGEDDGSSGAPDGWEENLVRAPESTQDAVEGEHKETDKSFPQEEAEANHVSLNPSAGDEHEEPPTQKRKLEEGPCTHIAQPWPATNVVEDLSLAH
eukprot:gene6798-4878_t